MNSTVSDTLQVITAPNITESSSPTPEPQMKHTSSLSLSNSMDVSSLPSPSATPTSSTQAHSISNININTNTTTNGGIDVISLLTPAPPRTIMPTLPILPMLPIQPTCNGINGRNGINGFGHPRTMAEFNIMAIAKELQNGNHIHKNRELLATVKRFREQVSLNKLQIGTLTEKVKIYKDEAEKYERLEIEYNKVKELNANLLSHNKNSKKESDKLKDKIKQLSHLKHTNNKSDAINAETESNIHLIQPLPIPEESNSDYISEHKQASGWLKNQRLMKLTGDQTYMTAHQKVIKDPNQKKSHQTYQRKETFKSIQNENKSLKDEIVQLTNQLEEARAQTGALTQDGLSADYLRNQLSKVRQELEVEKKISTKFKLAVNSCDDVDTLKQKLGQSNSELERLKIRYEKSKQRVENLSFESEKAKKEKDLALRENETTKENTKNMISQAKEHIVKITNECSIYKKETLRLSKENARLLHRETNESELEKTIDKLNKRIKHCERDCKKHKKRYKDLKYQIDSTDSPITLRSKKARKRGRPKKNELSVYCSTDSEARQDRMVKKTAKMIKKWDKKHEKKEKKERKKCNDILNEINSAIAIDNGEDELIWSDEEQELMPSILADGMEIIPNILAQPPPMVHETMIHSPVLSTVPVCSPTTARPIATNTGTNEEPKQVEAGQEDEEDEFVDHELGAISNANDLFIASGVMSPSQKPIANLSHSNPFTLNQKSETENGRPQPLFGFVSDSSEADHSDRSNYNFQPPMQSQPEPLFPDTHCDNDTEKSISFDVEVGVKVEETNTNTNNKKRERDNTETTEPLPKKRKLDTSKSSSAPPMSNDNQFQIREFSEDYISTQFSDWRAEFTYLITQKSDELSGSDLLSSCIHSILCRWQFAHCECDRNNGAKEVSLGILDILCVQKYEQICSDHYFSASNESKYLPFIASLCDIICKLDTFYCNKKNELILFIMKRCTKIINRKMFPNLEPKVLYLICGLLSVLCKSIRDEGRFWRFALLLMPLFPLHHCADLYCIMFECYAMQIDAHKHAFVQNCFKYVFISHAHSVVFGGHNSSNDQLYRKAKECYQRLMNVVGDKWNYFLDNNRDAILTKQLHLLCNNNGFLEANICDDTLNGITLMCGCDIRYSINLFLPNILYPLIYKHFAVKHEAKLQCFLLDLYFECTNRAFKQLKKCNEKSQINVVQNEIVLLMQSILAVSVATSIVSPQTVSPSVVVCCLENLFKMRTKDFVQDIIYANVYSDQQLSTFVTNVFKEWKDRITNLNGKEQIREQSHFNALMNITLNVFKKKSYNVQLFQSLKKQILNS